MLNKLLLLDVCRCGWYFTAAIASVFLGMSILMTSISPFGHNTLFVLAPCGIFFGLSLIAWTKAMDTLMAKSLLSEYSALMMTLPVSEKDMVTSKILIGTISGSTFYILSAFMVIIYLYCYREADSAFTYLSSLVIDHGGNALDAAFSIGLLPLLLVLEQFFFNGLALYLLLLCSGKKVLQKFTPVICFFIVSLQLALNVYLVITFPIFAAAFDLTYLTLTAAAGFLVFSVMIFRGCIHSLKYQYMY